MENKPACLYCGKHDNEVPLINLTYMGKPLWICSTDLPLLIHEPDKLATRLAEAVKNR
jgi:hypothetical protein